MKLTIPVFVIIQFDSDEDFNPIKLYEEIFGDKTLAESRVEELIEAHKGILEYDIIEEKVEIEVELSN